jgi:putative protease
LDRRLRQSFAGDKPHFRRRLDLETHGAIGKPLTVVGHDESGHIARVESAMALAAAEKQPLTTERLREQLGRLGRTPFQLGELKNSLEGQVIVPMSELNRLRRALVEELEALRAKPLRWTLNQSASIPKLPHSPDLSTRPKLIVLAREMAQLEAALAAELPTIYCEFEDPKKYRAAVARVRAVSPKSEIFVAAPRIFKTGEDWILKQVRSSEADGYLLRNYDHLKYFADCRRVGDFSFNVANALSAQYFKERFGLERLTASYDLNITQLEALLQSAPPEWFEITLHQHIPMFHMEHCVFCAFLSAGTDYTNCGRPCDKHKVAVRDRVGQAHPLKADAGCRNTVFNARAQTGAEYAGKLLALGARHFRIEFVNETESETAASIRKYQALLDGKISGTDLWRDLKLQNQLGVTRGPMAA